MSDSAATPPTPAAASSAASAATPAGPGREARLNWDDRKMVTTFANVVNIQSTREQVDLFFGTNQTWNLSGERAVTVELSNRIILSPFAAKRLWLVLGGVLREYEQRYGTLDVER